MPSSTHDSAYKPCHAAGLEINSHSYRGLNPSLPALLADTLTIRPPIDIQYQLQLQVIRHTQTHTHMSHTVMRLTVRDEPQAIVDS